MLRCAGINLFHGLSMAIVQSLKERASNEVAASWSGATLGGINAKMDKSLFRTTNVNHLKKIVEFEPVVDGYSKNVQELRDPGNGGVDKNLDKYIALQDKMRIEFNKIFSEGAPPLKDEELKAYPQKVVDAKAKVALLSYPQKLFKAALIVGKLPQVMDDLKWLNKESGLNLTIEHYQNETHKFVLEQTGFNVTTNYIEPTIKVCSGLLMSIAAKNLYPAIDAVVHTATGQRLIQENLGVDNQVYANTFYVVAQSGLAYSFGWFSAPVAVLGGAMQLASVGLDYATIPQEFESYAEYTKPALVISSQVANIALNPLKIVKAIEIAHLAREGYELTKPYHKYAKALGCKLIEFGAQDFQQGDWLRQQGLFSVSYMSIDYRNIDWSKMFSENLFSFQKQMKPYIDSFAQSASEQWHEYGKPCSDVVAEWFNYYLENLGKSGALHSEQLKVTEKDL